MLTEYETGFTILETSELTGTALLADVADGLESLLADRRSEVSPISTEREISALSGYVIIGADRLHPIDPRHTLRIQARLCTEGQSVTAQIRSRFISGDENDPADLTAGPPLALREIVGNYRCEIGTSQFRYSFRKEVFQVDDVPTARQVMSFITNPDRRVPVLVLTEDSTGRTAIEPQDAFDYLLGLALVVRFVGNTSSHIRDATGQACYNGAMRFYWPGGSVSKFYWPQDAAAISVTQFQKDCIDNAETLDLNGDFEQIFSAARTRVIREQRIEREQAAQSETATQLKEALERISELEHQTRETEVKHKQVVNELLEQLSNERTNSLSDSDKDKEIRRQRAEIASLRGIRKKLESANGDLRRTQKVDKDTIENLTLRNKKLAAAEPPVIAGTALDGGLQLTGDAGIDNVTVLNHAINIYRNPARQFIIRALRKRYNDVEEQCKIIERTINSADDRKRLWEARNERNIQDGIDVGHFENIVMDNRACFGEKPRLSTRMSDVRQVRNAAAHPKYNGIDSLRAKDGLNKVARALREMDNNDDSKLVERLLPLVR